MPRGTAPAVRHGRAAWNGPLRSGERPVTPCFPQQRHRPRLCGTARDAGAVAPGGRTAVLLLFEVRREDPDGLVAGRVNALRFPEGAREAQPVGEMTGSLAGPRRHAVVHGEVAQLGPGLQRRRAVAPGAVQPAAAQRGARQLRGRQQQTEEQHAAGRIQYGQPPAGRVRRGVRARERQRRRSGQRRGVGADARQEAVVVFVRAGAAARTGHPWHRTAPHRVTGSVRTAPSPVPGNTVPARHGRHAHRPRTPAGRPGPRSTPWRRWAVPGHSRRRSGWGCLPAGPSPPWPTRNGCSIRSSGSGSPPARTIRCRHSRPAPGTAVNRKIRPSAGTAGWPGPGRREWSFPRSRPRRSSARSPGRWPASG